MLSSVPDEKIYIDYTIYCRNDFAARAKSETGKIYQIVAY